MFPKLISGHTGFPPRSLVPNLAYFGSIAALCALMMPHSHPYPFIDPLQFRQKLAGSVVLITGASRGIGKAIAEAFASAESNVACVARSQHDVDVVARSLESQYGIRALALVADVSDASAPSKVIEKVEVELGPIDILVNNAGMDRFNTLEHEQNFSDWWRVIEVNFKGPAAFTHAILPSMIARHKGTIISIGSRNAVTCRPFSTSYSASKAALHRFHHNLDLEVKGHGIRQYIVQPGNVPTTIAHQPGAIAMTTVEQVPAFQKMLNDSIGTATESPSLCGCVCVWLAGHEDAHLLSGKCVDAQDGLEVLLRDLAKGHESLIERNNLYMLTMKELD